MSDWRTVAEWDWVQIGTRNVMLHAVDQLENEDSVDNDWYGIGTTACGKHGELWIPGLLSRMNQRRCAACCDATGMPRGRQSPKNIDECRSVAEARIDALSRTEKT